MRWRLGLRCCISAAVLAMSLVISRPSPAADGLAACVALATGDINISDVNKAKDFIANHGSCIPDFLDTDVFDPLAALLTGCVALSDQCGQYLTDLSNLAGTPEFIQKLNELLGILPDGDVKNGIASLLGNASVGQEYFTCAAAVALSGIGDQLKDIVHDLKECGDSIGKALQAVWNGIKDVAKCGEYILTLGAAGSCGGDDDNTPVLVDCTTQPLSGSYQNKGGGVYVDGKATCYCPIPMVMHAYEAWGPYGDNNYQQVYCECPYSDQKLVALGYCKCPDHSVAQYNPDNPGYCKTCPAGLDVVNEDCGCKNPNLVVRTSSSGDQFCGCPNQNEGLLDGTCQQCPAPHCVVKENGTFGMVTSKLVGAKCVSSGENFPFNYCGYGLKPNASSCQCGPACPDNQIIDNKIAQTGILTGGKDCKACASDQYPTYDDGTGKNSIGQCDSCAPGLSWYPPVVQGLGVVNSSAYAQGCSCSPGTCMQGDKCVKKNTGCPDWQHVDPNNCAACVDWCQKGSSYGGIASTTPELSTSDGEQKHAVGVEKSPATSENPGGGGLGAGSDVIVHPICNPCDPGQTTKDGKCATCAAGTKSDGMGSCQLICGDDERYVALSTSIGGNTKRTGPFCEKCDTGKHSDPNDARKCSNICAPGEYFANSLRVKGAAGDSGPTTVSTKTQCLPCNSGLTNPTNPTKCLPPAGKTVSTPSTPQRNQKAIGQSKGPINCPPQMMPNASGTGCIPRLNTGDFFGPGSLPGGGRTQTGVAPPSGPAMRNR